MLYLSTSVRNTFRVLIVLLNPDAIISAFRARNSHPFLQNSLAQLQFFLVEMLSLSVVDARR